MIQPFLDSITAKTAILMAIGEAIGISAWKGAGGARMKERLPRAGGAFHGLGRFARDPGAGKPLRRYGGR
jgi:hypothetical protein